MRKLVFIGLFLFVSKALASESLAEPSFQIGSNKRIVLSVETVADSVKYSPNLPSGGFAEPDSRQRYAKQSLEYSQAIGGKRTITAGFSSHTITSLRDSVKVNQFKFNLGQLYRINPHRKLQLSFGAKHNFVNEFNKNSFTETSEGIITSATIHNPRDFDLFISAEIENRLTNKSFFSAKAVIGLQATKFSRIDGVATSNSGCDLNFDVSNEGGSISQIRPCGAVQAYEQSFPNNATLNERLGITPAEDIQYSGVYLGQDFAYQLAVGARTQLIFGYSMRYFNRQTIDDAIGLRVR